MKRKITGLILFIILSIGSTSSLYAQADCSLNGAPATDNCPAGTAGDDIFIITGEVTEQILPGTGNDIIIMSGNGFINRPVGWQFFGVRNFDGGGLTVIGGTIITIGDGSHGIFEKGAGDVVSFAIIITSGGVARGIQEENDGDAINNGIIITSGDVSPGVTASYGLREGHDGDAINNGIIITSGDGASGIAEHGAGDVINNGIIIVTGSDANGIEEIMAGNVINNGTITASNNGILTDDDSTIVTNNGTITANNNAVQTGNGNDIVINNGTANGNIILGGGDDIMVVNGVVNGMMDGGGGTDRIVFTLTVVGNIHDYDRVAAQLTAMSPAGGSIIINGQLYEWQNFEELVNLLRFVDSAPQPCAFDGRINNYDCHAPIAIYGYPLEIYAINPDTNGGEYAFSISQAMIDAAGIPATGTVLIHEGFNQFTGASIALYRHANGDFQINTTFPDGKLYVGQWTQYGSYTNLSGNFG